MSWIRRKSKTKGEARVLGSALAAERGAGPLELIGLDKDWAGGWGSGGQISILPTPGPIIVIRPEHIQQIEPSDDIWTTTSQGGSSGR